MFLGSGFFNALHHLRLGSIPGYWKQRVAQVVHDTHVVIVLFTSKHGLLIGRLTSQIVHPRIYRDTCSVRLVHVEHKTTHTIESRVPIKPSILHVQTVRCKSSHHRSRSTRKQGYFLITYNFKDGHTINTIKIINGWPRVHKEVCVTRISCRRCIRSWCTTAFVPGALSLEVFNTSTYPTFHDLAITALGVLSTSLTFS